MSSLSEKSAFEAFARMEEKIDQSERQIRASAEIDEEFTGDRPCPRISSSSSKVLGRTTRISDCCN